MKKLLTLFIISLTLVSCSNPNDVERIAELEKQISENNISEKTFGFNMQKECAEITEKYGDEYIEEYSSEKVGYSQTTLINQTIYDKLGNRCLIESSTYTIYLGKLTITYALYDLLRQYDVLESELESDIKDKIKEMTK